MTPQHKLDKLPYYTVTVQKNRKIDGYAYRATMRIMPYDPPCEWVFGHGDTPESARFDLLRRVAKTNFYLPVRGVIDGCADRQGGT